MLPSTSIGSFTGFKAHEFVAHTGKTNCVAVGPRSGQVLATGGDDKRVNVWRIGRASSIWSLTGNSSAIESLRFDPTEEFLVSGSAGGAVKLFDLSAGKMTRHFRGHMSNVTVIDCGSFDRRFVTTGSMDCQVKLWNVETKQCAMGFKGHNAEITDVQFSPDGYILASAAADGQVKLWDLRAGKPMHTFQACSGAVRALRFNPQEFLLAVSTSDRTVKLYDIEFMELFCTTAPDTCQTRAITFDPDGQNMYCASPSGLRRWTWDNDTSTAKLGTMGDVAWGKVGAGALHYNADGQQLLAASCAGSRVSVWAVDFDTDAPPPGRQEPRQQPGENGVNPFGSRGATRSHGAPAAVASNFAGPSASALSSEAATAAAAAAVAAMGAATGRNTAAFQLSVAGIGSDSVGRGRGGLGKGSEDASGKVRPQPGSRSSGTSGSRERTREERARDSQRVEDKALDEDSADSHAFQVLGRHLPLSTAADEKTSSPAANPSAVPAAAATNPCAADASEAGSSSVVAANGGANGGPERRFTRAAAVAAAVAAVATAKAATDDAVASVSSSGRHRSIGTSISDTLVITSSTSRGGGGGHGGDDGGSNLAEGGGQQPAAWPERAPGKEDGGIAGEQGLAVGSSRHHGGRLAGNEVEHKWHKRVTGTFACDAAAGDKFGDRVGTGQPGARGDGTLSKQDAGRPAAAQGAASSATPSDLMINPWPQASRGGGGRYRQALDGMEARGGGGDSPPLMGSPESPPPAARHSPPFPPSRGSPDDSREEKPVGVVARSMAGFPTTSAAAPGGDSDLTPGLNSAGASREGDVWIADDGREGARGELGMTRPRTATRRWDRPGPPGEDELIAQTLLSRASVTSALSKRLTHLRVLRSSWADGDISGTISRLVRLENSATTSDASPRAVVADFLWVVPLEGARVTLEHCLELMPLLEDLWKLDADSSVAAGTRCLESVVRRFGGFVRSTLEASVAAGRVDLAREERMGRCREAHRAFIRGYHHLERAEREFYEDRRIAAVARRLRPLFESYFIS